MTASTTHVAGQTRTPHSGTRRRDWLIPAGLVLLSLVPVIAGADRVASLAVGVETTPENARFTGMPAPVIIHIVSATVYSLLGAFQFQPGFRARHPKWHRVAGRVLVPAGLATALSGLWMTQFYVLPAHDGGLLPAARWVFGVGMFVAIVLGFVAVLRRRFDAHRAWMMRGYAIALGAGTQVITMGAWVAIGGNPETTKAVPMIAGWVINPAVAEWIIRRHVLRTARVPRRMQA
ncbi:DUF2306 domain-containing protein [Humibacter soli]